MITDSYLARPPFFTLPGNQASDSLYICLRFLRNNHYFNKGGFRPVGDLCQLKALGRHILAEFFHCDVDKLNDPVAIQNLMLGAANACGATVVQTVFHSFNPHGVSGVVVIAESHLAIHTWPEYGHAAVDVFTCGDSIDPADALEYLREGLAAQEVSSQEVDRLRIPTPQFVPQKRELQEVESASPD